VRDPRGNERFLRGSRRFGPRRATGSDALRMPAAPLFAPVVRRNRRCLVGPSPARRSPRQRYALIGKGRRRPSNGLAIPASRKTFWPKQTAGGGCRTLAHRHRQRSGDSRTGDESHGP